MSYHICLVERHENLNRLFTTYLNQEGWKVSAFQSEEEALTDHEDSIDLWVMDIVLPNQDGSKLVEQVKITFPGIPIIFMSDHDRILEQIASYNFVGVDCMAKPFLPRELIHRIRQLQEKGDAECS